MPSVAVPVYRALYRAVKLFSDSGVPLVGLKGFPYPPPCAHPVHTLNYLFRQHDNFDRAFLALRLLHKQLDFFAGCDEHTKNALAEWHAGVLTAQQLPTSAGVEAIAHTLHSIWEQQQQQQQELFLDIDTDCDNTQKDKGAASVQLLESIAADVQKERPDLFLSASGGTELRPSGSGQILGEQLHCISKVLFRDCQFKSHPLEWVYDGLAPVLLPELLETRKGVPVALAVVYTAVARRVGLDLVPVCTEGGPPDTGTLLTDLPPEVAARQAARTLASAPPPNSWVVAAPLRGSLGVSLEGSLEAPVLYVDVGRKGEVLSAEECTQRYPAMSKKLPKPHQVPVLLAAEFARTMLTAHQRRGESDEAAHWLYQMLALDPTAPEWDHFLVDKQM